MYLLFFFILWTIFWSFGSVILTRFEKGVNMKSLKSFVMGHSKCPDCKHKLSWKNLIPLISFGVQKGKCQYCKKNISRMYPVLEFLCGIIFVASFQITKDMGTGVIILGMLTNWLLVLILVFDVMKYKLHMVARGMLVAVWILANIMLSTGHIIWAGICVIIFAWVFLCIYYFAKIYTKRRFKISWEWFGMGDVYLAGTIGLLIPLIIKDISWMKLIEILVIWTLCSSVIGLIWSAFWLLLKKICKRTPLFISKYLSSFAIPFFPSMIIAFRLMIWQLPFLLALFFPWS